VKPASPRRRWRIVATLVLAPVLLVTLAWPFLVRAVFEDQLPKEWGGPADVGGATWSLGRRVVLHDVVSAPRPGDPSRVAVERIELEFQNRLLFDEPGRLVAGDFVGGTLHHEGRAVATLAAVRYRWDPARGAELAIEGLDGVLDTRHVDDWIAVIRRIVEAPGIGGRGDEGGDDDRRANDASDANTDASAGPSAARTDDGRLRAIRVPDARLTVGLALDDGAATILPLAPFSCTLRPTAPRALAIEHLSARLFGGEIDAHGDADWSGGPVAWRVQANLRHLDLAAAGGTIDWLPASSVGAVSAFADLHANGDGSLGGAGWVEGTRVAVWDLPEAKAVLGELGVQPRRDDVLDELRAQLLLDRGRLWFEQIVALGEPVNLFGNGSLRLDGSELEVGLVPRFRDKDLADIPLGQPRARDVLLDVLKGALLEVRIEGSLDGVRTFVQPVPAVTEPLRQFLSWFR
jgi:hypothetical protein